MNKYAANATWLWWFIPFRSLGVKGAYLTPFFLGHGLSTAQVFMLQSIFAVIYITWEPISGYLADRLGRALSIKLSVPVAAIGLIAYGFSSHFWQFVLCEAALALASGLISGANVALLHDSLNDGAAFERISKHMNIVGFATLGVGMLATIPIVATFGLGATLVADGALSVLSLVVVLRLIEPPRSSNDAKVTVRETWRGFRRMMSFHDARWLIVLTVSFGVAGYLASWLAGPYYQSIGLPIAAFGYILAGQNLFKALWVVGSMAYAKRVAAKHHLGITMAKYGALTVVSYFAMASGMPVMFVLVFGLDIALAMKDPPLNTLLNRRMEAAFRATLNSTVSFARLLVCAVAGPLVGFAVDAWGLRLGLLLAGLACGGGVFLAVKKLWPYFADTPKE